MEYVILGKPEYMAEAVTGSSSEASLAEKIAEELKPYTDHVRFFETPVDSWREENCTVEAGSTAAPCHAMPYTVSADVESNIVEANYVGDRIALTQPVEGRIVTIPFPQDPDDIKYVVLKLYEHGAVAVIFYDELPGRYRRMVLIGDEDYSHTHGSPSPIPAVSIMKEDYLKLRKLGLGRVRIKIRAHVVHGAKGKTVIACINGRGEKEIHVTAHHDHWFYGFSDNMIGVELLLQLARRLKDWKGPNLVLISYTAEEFGAPYYTSWYWTWGSRYYMDILEKQGGIDGIIADINVDALYTKPFMINGNPALGKCIDAISSSRPAIYRGYDHTDFDSYTYTMHGIPALTMHNLFEMKHIYHTNLDDGREVGDHIITEALNTLIDMTKCVARNKTSYERLMSRMREELPQPPNPEQAALIGRLENLDKLISNESTRIRLATRLASTISYIPSLDGVFYSEMFSDLRIIRELMASIEKYYGKRIRVKVVDREQFLDISPTKYNHEELRKALVHAYNQRLREYHRQLDRLISEILMKKKESSKT